MNIAFTILKVGKFNDDSMEMAKPYLIQALKMSSKSPDNEELEKIFSISTLLANYFKGKPLTEVQIYMMTVFSSVLNNNLANLSPEMKQNQLIEKKIDGVNQFVRQIQKFYNALNLSLSFKHEYYDSYISQVQKNCFSQQDPVTPEGLTSMQQKMKTAD